jgi:hypothetical protein
MTGKNNNAMVKSVATALIVGSLSLATLTTGCDTPSAEQIAALTSASTTQASGPLGVVQKPELVSRLAGNHNETFLS